MLGMRPCAGDGGFGEAALAVCDIQGGPVSAVFGTDLSEW